MEARRAPPGLISETHLIDFFLHHPFVFLFDESTDMHHASHVALAGRRGEAQRTVWLMNM